MVCFQQWHGVSHEYICSSYALYLTLVDHFREKTNYKVGCTSLLSSLHFLFPFPTKFGYSYESCQLWAEKIIFKSFLTRMMLQTTATNLYINPLSILLFLLIFISKGINKYQKYVWWWSGGGGPFLNFGPIHYIIHIFWLQVQGYINTTYGCIACISPINSLLLLIIYYYGWLTYLLYPLKTVAYDPSPNCSSFMYASDLPNGESPYFPEKKV